jgi:hypothetical protein
MDSTISLSSVSAQITVILDTDGNGIPDTWELAFDLNPFAAGNANADKIAMECLTMMSSSQEPILAIQGVSWGYNEYQWLIGRK